MEDFHLIEKLQQVLAGTALNPLKRHTWRLATAACVQQPAHCIPTSMSNCFDLTAIPSSVACYHGAAPPFVPNPAYCVQFDREKTPERIVHARGMTAKGTFEITHDISHLTSAAFLNGVGSKVNSSSIDFMSYGPAALWMQSCYAVNHAGSRIALCTLPLRADSPWCELQTCASCRDGLCSARDSGFAIQDGPSPKCTPLWSTP